MSEICVTKQKSNSIKTHYRNDNGKTSQVILQTKKLKLEETLKVCLKSLSL